MSSSGTISRVYITPTTSYTEAQRQIESTIGSLPSLHEAIRSQVGIINTIHPEKAHLIKAHATDGTPLANNSWIELNHSAQEIAERWGTVRIGFRIRVTFSGPSGAGADATIIGVEGQNVDEPFIDNDVERGLFSIFAPGIGLG